MKLNLIDNESDPPPKAFKELSPTMPSLRLASHGKLGFLCTSIPNQAFG